MKQHTTGIDELLTMRVARAAHVLDVPRSTIYFWIKHGILPAIKIGEVTLIRREEVDKLLLRHTFRPQQNARRAS